MKEVKPIYFELQGYLSQAPEREKGMIFERQVWEQHNLTIDELEKVTTDTEYNQLEIMLVDLV